MKKLGIIGIATESTIDYYRTIIALYRARKAELPLILRDPASNEVPLLNTTRIHCEAAVDRMFS